MKDAKDTIVRANQPVLSHGRNRAGKVPAAREPRYNKAQTRSGVHAIAKRDDRLMLRIIDLLTASAAVREITTASTIDAKSPLPQNAAFLAKKAHACVMACSRQLTQGA